MSACLEIPDLFLVLNMISHSFAALTREISFNTRNKSGISAHPWPCIVLYKLQIIQLNFSITKSSLKYEIIFHNFVCWRFSTPAPAKYSGAPALVPVLRLQRTALLSASKAWFTANEWTRTQKYRSKQFFRMSFIRSHFQEEKNRWQNC
jgi:hypothetical protein